MNSVKINLLACRKYLSRFILLLLLMAVLGCEDEGCDYIDPCGEGVMIRKGFAEPVILTKDNPTIRVITDEACGFGSGKYYVYYQYHDIPTTPASYTYTEDPQTNTKSSSSSPAVRQATEKDKPTVVAKFGTLEHGVQSGATDSKPGFINGWWAVNGEGYPPKVKEGTTPSPVHYVLTVTLQKPVVTLPGTPPSISLPFIGPIIGPQTRDVDVEILLEYQKPVPPAK